MASARRYDVTFFTATILEWKHLLANDAYKCIIIDSLRFMAERQRAMVHAFCIMNNHIHLLWHIIHPHTRDEVQRDFLKFTSQTMLYDLRTNHKELLPDYFVGATDRKYQIWERKPLSVELWTEAVVKEKLNYIHNNPVRAGLCALPEEYLFSTANLYNGETSKHDFVTPIYF